MALQLVEPSPGRFRYKCDNCGFEFPKDQPVTQSELGPPPEHHCPNEGRVNVKKIMERQD
jgi:hypothetical protein